MFAKQCKCGAVTVITDDFSNSMPIEMFEKEFPNISLEPDKFYSCNYCVNKYGVDLCGCGSGEKVGKCEGEYYECRNNISSQTFMKQKEWVCRY